MKCEFMKFATAAVAFMAWDAGRKMIFIGSEYAESQRRLSSVIVEPCGMLPKNKHNWSGNTTLMLFYADARRQLSSVGWEKTDVFNLFKGILRP